jgi:aminoglycoside/choline kinase family phosphotransferase
MPKEIKLPESLLKFIACRPGSQLHKIRSEASRRRFFRISWGKETCVAMVYPEKSPDEVSRFLNVRNVYEKNGLRVPGLIEALDDQVLILEDAGDLLLQRAWRLSRGGERQRLLAQCVGILKKLSAIAPPLTVARLDPARQQWEMDFFLQHFFLHYPGGEQTAETLRKGLIRLVENIDPENTFAHRDFHSRNLLVQRGEVVMVDFQDSLLAPRYYDLVSLAFDSYLDLGCAREILLSGQEWTAHECRQLRLTALQRNIKALGTFAYQVHKRGHAVYEKYIPRTLRHIQRHLRELGDSGFAVLTEYFAAVVRNG